MNLRTIALLRRALVHFVVPLLLIGTAAARGGSCASSIIGSDEQSAVPIYRGSVSEVRLVFFATDEGNHPVVNLQKGNIVVVDDDEVIRDYSLSRGNLIDLDVIVLIDFSESILPRLKQELESVSQLVSRWPWRAGDRLSMFSFNGTQVAPICSGKGCSVLKLDDQIRSLPRGGPTPLYDALGDAADLLVQHDARNTWPLIILFSDGRDTVSKTSFRQAWQRILISGAQIYAIDLGGDEPPPNGNSILRKLATDSGGRCVPISEGAMKVLGDVIGDLHSAMVVTYSPTSSKTAFHSVHIFSTYNPRLHFRSRRGYYRPGNGP